MVRVVSLRGFSKCKHTGKGRGQGQGRPGLGHQTLTSAPCWKPNFYGQEFPGLSLASPFTSSEPAAYIILLQPTSFSWREEAAFSLGKDSLACLLSPFPGHSGLELARGS